MKLPPPRVHRIEPAARQSPAKPVPVLDYLERGLAWARVQLLHDGRVIVDGPRGSVTLDDEHGAELAAKVRLMGVRERR